MKLGDVFEMIKNLQQGDHHDDYKRGNHDQQGYRGKYNSDDHDGKHSQYQNYNSLQRQICSKCGKEISSEHKFCPNCGVDCKAGLECKSCHGKVKPGDPFCSLCGNKL